MNRKEWLLPTNTTEMKARGWSELDVIFMTADAYCDHPSFGVAILSRLLESEGYRVGIIAAPDWKKNDDFLKLGRPRLFFGVTAGNLDSMLNIYTSQMNRRRQDKYLPGGIGGLRPKLATIVYSNKLRELFGPVPIVIGGIEASMRRLTHYDFWTDSVRRPILFDSRADILAYGMAEHQILAIAQRLKEGQQVSSLTDIRGTCAVVSRERASLDAVRLPSYEEVVADKKVFVEFFKMYSRHLNPYTAKPLVQSVANRDCLVCPPSLPLTEVEMDRIYGLPYTRRCHPDYDKYGGVPALKTVESSIVSHRGCAASCSFCSLSLHQGRVIQSRSVASIVGEAAQLAARPSFSGVISDVGGPTANMYAARCARDHACSREDCLWPDICQNFQPNFSQQVRMLEAVAKVARVKKVNIQSGVRYDLLLLPQAKEYFDRLCRCHVSGQLKIAPEHVCESVLALMHKPPYKKYREFAQMYARENQTLGKKQFLAQYFITAHPGCGEVEARQLAEAVKKMGYIPEQLQDFIPLPMTRSSCMYYTGIDPQTGRAVYVPKTTKERLSQREMIQGKANRDQKKMLPRRKAHHGRRPGSSSNPAM